MEFSQKLGAFVHERVIIGLFVIIEFLELIQELTIVIHSTEHKNAFIDFESALIAATGDNRLVENNLLHDSVGFVVENQDVVG